MKYTEEEQERIKFLIEKMKKDKITPEEYQYLQFLLMKYEFLISKRHRYPLCKTKITGDKILFISDSHVGSKNESPYLFNVAYNAALAQNITTAVHAGDMIEATAKEWDKPIDKIIEEIRRAYSYIPDMRGLPNEIITYFLLGNHEINAVHGHGEIIPAFFENPKVRILGLYKVLLDWDGATFQLNHFTPQLYMRIDNEDPKGLMEIDGHHHRFYFDEENRRLDLPALSKDAFLLIDNFLHSLKITASPAFIIASKEGINLRLFRSYSVDKSNNFYYPTSAVEVDTETKRLRFYKN